MRGCSNASQVIRLYDYFFNYSNNCLCSTLFQTRSVQYLLYCKSSHLLRVQDLSGETVDKMTCIDLTEGLRQSSISGFIQSVVTCRVASCCCQDPQAVERPPQFGCCLGNLAFTSWSGQTPRLSLSTTAVSTVGGQLEIVGCVLMVLASNKPALLWISVFIRDGAHATVGSALVKMSQKIWPLLCVG